MKSHLIKYLPARSEDSPVLVLYDGHKSHVSLGLIEWAKSEHIILFVFPPHCSHLLQPLDVSCFGPFEIAWNSACHRNMRETGGKVVTRYDVCRLTCQVYSSTITAANIQSAFKFPFNPKVITDPQVAPSTSFSHTTVEQVKPTEPTVSSCKDRVSSASAEDFLLKKCGEILQNVETAKKPRNTLSKIAGDKAITDDNIVAKIMEHNQNQTKKHKTSEKNQLNLNQAQVEPSQKKSQSKQIKTVQDSQVASTSGVPAAKKSKQDKVLSEDLFSSDSEDELPEKSKCIICKRANPDWSKKPFIFILNWGQCDKCDGWVHLSFCTPVRILKRGDPFICPIQNPNVKSKIKP